MHFQPLVDLTGGRITGFEALARITERDGSLTLPAEFIPVAEESGLVVPLGAKVLTLACQQAQHWQPRAIADRALTVAVNLSARQFGYGDLSAAVQSTLERTGLPPSCLHLELTETAIMEILDLGLSRYQMGAAAAESYLLALFLGVVSIVNFWLMRDRDAAA